MVLGAAAALVATACGGGASVENAADPLPPDASSACEVGAPDCGDIVNGNNEPLFVDGETDLDGDPGGSSGLVIDGGLSVEEALDSDATGRIAVQGFVVGDDPGIRLCDLLAESLPPLCGGASIEVTDLDTVDPDELNSAQGVMWSDQPVATLVSARILIPPSGWVCDGECWMFDPRWVPAGRVGD